MADITFNVAKGRINELVNRVNDNDPANSALIVVLLQASETDATLQDYDNLSLLLAAAGNTEATFTNYARKVLSDTDIAAPTVDDTANTQWSDIPDQVYTSAGGATNNTLTKLLVCYDSDTTGGDDTNIIPLTAQDFSATTTGSDMTAVISATGFFSAS